MLINDFAKSESFSDQHALLDFSILNRVLLYVFEQVK